MQVGIVDFNGEVALFNALTAAGASGGEPFCTIDPERGRRRRTGRAAGRPSPRRRSSRARNPTAIEVVDIAGLVEGAECGGGTREPVPEPHPAGRRSSTSSLLSVQRRRSCLWRRRSAPGQAGHRHRASFGRPAGRGEALRASGEAGPDRPEGAGCGTLRPREAPAGAPRGGSSTSDRAERGRGGGGALLWTTDEKARDLCRERSEEEVASAVRDPRRCLHGRCR
jgi:hypothetical protein